MSSTLLTLSEIELATLSSISMTTSPAASISDDSHILVLPDPTENEVSDYPEGGLKAYSVVFGSFLGLIANFGIMNSVGAIQAYIATHQLAGVNASTVSWIFSIYMSLSFAVGILVGPYFDARGSFRLLAGGCVLEFIGFMGVAQSRTVWQFILSLSICVGLGNALCITPLVSVVSHWFLVKRGRANGIATIGGSVGGIVIPLMLAALYPKVGFPWAIRILGFFCLCCMVSATILAKERFIQADEIAQEATPSGKRKFLAQTKGFLNFSALLDLKYSFLIGGAFCAELALMSMVTYFATYAIAQGMSESSSYVLLTIFNATGVLGRLLPGFLSDTFGHYNVMILMLIGVDLSMFLMWIPFGSNPTLLYAFAAVCGFFSASILSLTPVCLGTITPIHKFGARYGLLYFFVSIGNLFGIPLGAAIIGDGSQRNYTMFSLFCGILALAGTASWTISRYCIVGFKINVKL